MTCERWRWEQPLVIYYMSFTNIKVPFTNIKKKQRIPQIKIILTSILFFFLRFSEKHNYKTKIFSIKIEAILLKIIFNLKDCDGNSIWQLIFCVVSLLRFMSCFSNYSKFEIFTVSKLRNEDFFYWDLCSYTLLLSQKSIFGNKNCLLK